MGWRCNCVTFTALEKIGFLHDLPIFTMDFSHACATHVSIWSTSGRHLVSMVILVPISGGMVNLVARWHFYSPNHIIFAVGCRKSISPSCCSVGQSHRQHMTTLTVRKPPIPHLRYTWTASDQEATDLRGCRPCLWLQHLTKYIVHKLEPKNAQRGWF